MKKEKTICAICGERESVCKGLCWNCYVRERARKKGSRTAPADRRDEQTKAIIKEYAVNSGIKQVDLARKYGVSKQRIHKILKDAGQI